MMYITGDDDKGTFIKWGPDGKKCYFDPNDKTSRQRAKKKVREQISDDVSSDKRKGKK